VRLIVALGAHRPMLRHELVAKLGATAVRELDIEQHHPYENLVDLGTSSRGIPIRLNKTFCEADLKISVGSVLPHPYMGFGGGAKIVVPGLAGIETLQANHQPAVTGISGGLCTADVDARHEVEEIALKAGLTFSCNAVVNDQRKIAGLFCGHPVAAHRQAVAFCRDVYATPVNGARHDVICLNAYPKDTELLQVGNALNCYRTTSTPPLKAAGTILITACCSTGRGYHSLHGKGMRLYRPPARKDYLGDHGIVVFSPNLSPRDFPVSFWPEYEFFRNWDDVTAHLARRHPGASVGVFPTAPLQILT
jgi:nickel-dependent lactate racemase